MDLKEKLEKDILETSWNPLAEHFAKGAVYLLDGDLELAEVGESMAGDNLSSVKEWLDNGLLYPPTPEEALKFSQTEEVLFNMLIIEPYVLIQRKIQA
jgi:hypothetical protein